jgi:hypothetical protein
MQCVECGNAQFIPVFSEQLKNRRGPFHHDGVMPDDRNGCPNARAESMQLRALGQRHVEDAGIAALMRTANVG